MQKIKIANIAGKIGYQNSLVCIAVGRNPDIVSEVFQFWILRIIMKYSWLNGKYRQKSHAHWEAECNFRSVYLRQQQSGTSPAKMIIIIVVKVTRVKTKLPIMSL